ncbi:hypothetical protein ACHAXA_006885 [Cyclostephanos tholiformis]|uniref:Uncharacterized protein n=1 Tax=Cyclostephanos tholiformis TaxID=382380 RepID=A0ABD3SDQ3_9STRA
MQQLEEMNRGMARYEREERQEKKRKKKHCQKCQKKKRWKRLAMQECFENQHDCGGRSQGTGNPPTTMQTRELDDTHPTPEEDAPPTASIAYAGSGARLRAARGCGDSVDDDAYDRRDDDAIVDKDDGRRKRIALYCLPCISFGIGEDGKRRVRVLTLIFFPLFLLGLFALDDLGRVVERGVRVHMQQQRADSTHVVVAPDSSTDLTTTTRDVPTPRYKWFNEYPRITREVMWIPMELRARASVDVRTPYEATLRCPKGMLFLFHGCGRYAASFFYSPQGRIIVERAYDAGLTVVTFKKTNELGCWDMSDDGDPVLYIGRKFMISQLKDACGSDENGNPVYPPVFAFGASSGGHFISALAARMKEDPDSYRPFLFAAMNVQIMAPPIGLDWDVPTLFTVMEGDPITRTNVQALVAARGGGSEGEGGGGGTFRVFTTAGKKGIHPRHFYDLYRDDKRMSIELSNGIYRDLVDARIIDPLNDDRLTGDPRGMTEAISTIYRKYLTAQRTSVKNEGLSPPLGVSYQLIRPMKAEELLDADGLWLIEELNVAWDVHEITAEGFEVVLGFFDEFGLAAM